MKKFLLISMCLLGLCHSNMAFADRYFTVRQGIPSYYDPIPTPYFISYTSCDPFMVKIDGEKYFMMIGSAPYTYRNLLGCDGSYKNSLFTPLEYLDINYDGVVSSDELIFSGIRFVWYKNSQRLVTNSTSTDYNLKQISHIPLSTVRFSISPASFGNFDVYVKQKNSTKLKKVIGRVEPTPERVASFMFR